MSILDAEDKSYLTNPELTKDFEFHLWDVVCKHCRKCASGSHRWYEIPHAPDCPLFEGKLEIKAKLRRSAAYLQGNTTDYFSKPALLAAIQILYRQADLFTVK